MPLDITAELKKTYDEAVMQHEARLLTKGEDWQQARTIMERGEVARAATQEKYLNEYDTRVEIVRKRLTKEAGDKNLDHPAPTGRDRFDGDVINRQTHREVRRDHERVLQQSRDTQDTDMQALQETASQRDQSKSIGKAPAKAKEHFAPASDRRQVPERRR